MDATFDRPQFVTGRAARLWEELAPEIRDRGILLPVDEPMFGHFCVMLAQVDELRSQFLIPPGVIESALERL